MTTYPKQLPAIGKLLHHDQVVPLVEQYGRELVTYCLRAGVDYAREGKRQATEVDILAFAESLIQRITAPSVISVINATGVVIHTNLGRAPLGKKIREEISDIIDGYCNVEFDLPRGKRGSRHDHLNSILRYLTGAEDALVVNNNAAALILALRTFAYRKEVIISRGELIEIGGAFRIPDIMKSAGVKMVEVGTTNKTRLSDYADALTPKTAMILKAHTSNYTITGFTEAVGVSVLASFAADHDLPFLYDIGSGLLRKPTGLPLEHEPDVQSAVSAGADIVTFSCDKLMGGPQAGVLTGKKQHINKCSRAPLMRALRVGKITIAALSAACRHYLDAQVLKQETPLFAMLERPISEVRTMAEQLREALSSRDVFSDVVDSTAQCGGGTLPDLVVPSAAVALRLPKKDADKMYRSLMTSETPVIGIMREGRLVFDMRTVEDHQISEIARQVHSAIKRNTK